MLGTMDRSTSYSSFGIPEPIFSSWISWLFWGRSLSLSLQLRCGSRFGWYFLWGLLRYWWWLLNCWQLLRAWTREVLLTFLSFGRWLRAIVGFWTFLRRGSLSLSERRSTKTWELSIIIIISANFFFFSHFVSGTYLKLEYIVIVMEIFDRNPWEKMK